MRLCVCHIRTNRETNVFISYLTDLCLGLYLCTKNSETQKENTCRKEENKARSIFFFPSFALQRKREPLSKDKIQVPLSKSNK